MIISDLNHFEVVAEPTNIVGGNKTSALLASNMLQGISDQLNSAPRLVWADMIQHVHESLPITHGGIVSIHTC